MEGLWYEWMTGEGASSQVCRQLARSAMKLFGAGLFHKVYIKKQTSKRASWSARVPQPQLHNGSI